MFKRFAHHGIVVSDLDKSAAFYQEFLPMKLMKTYDIDGEAFEEATGLPGVHIRVASLENFDGHILNLMEYLHPKGKQKCEVDFLDIGSSHRTILLDSIQETYETLRDRGVEFIAPPVQPAPDNDPSVMFAYLRDPDGLIVELVQNSIFHCAFNVADFDKAVAFYRDTLGFKIWKFRDLKGHGIEKGVRVPGINLKVAHVTLDNSESIELVHFANRKVGRQHKIEFNDVGCPHVAFDVDDVEQTYTELSTQGIEFLSKPVHLNTEKAKVTMVFMRDLNGYVLELRSGS